MKDNTLRDALRLSEEAIASSEAWFNREAAVVSTTAIENPYVRALKNMKALGEKEITFPLV